VKRKMSPSDRPTRILIVDDHPMVRDMVRLGCEDDPSLEVVGEAGTGRDALVACRNLEPDVMVLDLLLPGMTGFEVIERLRREGSKIRVLVLTNRDDRDAIFESFRMGVDGFLEKTAPLKEIVRAIATVGKGGQVFRAEHERLAHRHLADMARKARRAASAALSLTKRERQVLDLITEGLTTRQMASRLMLSERTVETHIANLYDKLDVRTRVQAVHRAAGLGLVDLDQG
jgi:DNA-binding NarL/FixJ family response regulator